MAKLVVGTNKSVAVPAIVKFSPDYYIERINNNGTLGPSLITKAPSLKGITNLSNYCFYYSYYQSRISGKAILDGENLTRITGSYALLGTFYGCTGITSTGLDYVEVLGGTNTLQDAFHSCTSLTTTGLNRLRQIGTATYDGSILYGTFSGCTSLTTTGLDNLEEIGGGSNSFRTAFYGCTNLLTAPFDKLHTINNSLASTYVRAPFGNCNKLESVTFAALTSVTFSSSVNQIQYLFNDSSGSQAPNGCTVHFPSNFDPNDPNHTFDASTLTGYPTFGGDANYIHVAFDLPATE